MQLVFDLLKGNRVAIRFDAGRIIRKPNHTPEGYFQAEAIFARDGILEYRTPDGKVRRELRKPETNKEALTGFGLKPISLEHPPVLINSENAKQYSVGLSDSTVYYDPSGFVRGVITVTDSEAVKSINDGKTLQISAGYKCNIDPTPGVWQGQHYDAIQTDLDVNHIALTQRGRAGEEVKICFDSIGQEDIAFQIVEDKKRMARVTIDSVTYDDIPETFASIAGQKIQEYEKARNRIDSLESEKITFESQVSELKKQVSDLEEERDRTLGRADGYEEIVNSAIPILEQEGYIWNQDSTEFTKKLTKKAKKTMPVEEEWEEESDEEPDDDSEEEDEEIEEKTPLKKRKSKKTDSIGEIISTWKKAEELGIEENRFDSELSADEVRKLALQELLPDTDFSGYSPAWIEGLFDAMYLESSSQEEELHNDSTLQDMVKIARSSSVVVAKTERSEQLENAWQSPLSLSK